MKAKGRGFGSSAPETRVLADAHARFSSLVIEWPCFFKENRKGHTCWGEIDPHHLVPASWIKSTFRGLSDAELGDILYAPILGELLGSDWKPIQLEYLATYPQPVDLQEAA